MNPGRSGDTGLGILQFGNLLRRALVARGTGALGGLLAAGGLSATAVAQGASKAERRAARQDDTDAGDRPRRADRAEQGADGDADRTRRVDRAEQPTDGDGRGNGRGGGSNDDDSTATAEPEPTAEPDPSPTLDDDDGGDAVAIADGGSIDDGDLDGLGDRIRAQVADALDGGDDGIDGPIAISGDDVVARTGPDGAFAQSGDNIARTGPDGPIAISGGGDDDDADDDDNDDGGDDNVDFAS